MLKISVVIITYNEEKNIARCIESVRDIADEIIVVDSFSKDRTKEICNQYGVKFIEHTFEGHIQQKNYAASLASNQMVLSLDADEALSDQLKNEILHLKPGVIADGYYFNRLTNFCGSWIHHCGWYPDQKLRLWNKDKGSWGGENPHDKFIMQNDALIKPLKGDLLHYSFYSIEQHMDTINKFSTIAARARFSKGKKANLPGVIFKPIIKFVAMYIFKLGILDGYYGFIICRNSAHSAFLKEIKLRELHKQKLEH